MRTTLTDTRGDLQNELWRCGTVFCCRIRRCIHRSLLLVLGSHHHRFRGGGVVVIGGLLVGDAEGGVLLFGDAHVVAGVALLHDVPGAGVEEDGVLVELGQLGRSNTDEGDSVSATK